MRRCSTTPEGTGEQRGSYRAASLRSRSRRSASCSDLRDSLLRLRDRMSAPHQEQPRRSGLKSTFASSTRASTWGEPPARSIAWPSSTREKWCRCAIRPAAPPRHRTPKQAAVGRGEQRPTGDRRDRGGELRGFIRPSGPKTALAWTPPSARPADARGAARLPMTWCRPVAAACTRHSLRLQAGRISPGEPSEPTHRALCDLGRRISRR